MSTRYKVELGQAIKRRREELGLTQKELADLTHYKEGQTVSRWERGQNLPGDLEIVATALQWTLPEMMAGIEPPDRRTARRAGIEPTPELFAATSQLDRIEGLLTELIERLVAADVIQAAGRDTAATQQDSSREYPQSAA
jgi:transcriptional regulator with XRE-family HTH domain